MSQHPLCLSSFLRLAYFTLGEALHIPSHSLDKGQSSLGLELPEIKIGHAPLVLPADDVPVVGVDSERAIVAT